MQFEAAISKRQLIRELENHFRGRPAGTSRSVGRSSESDEPDPTPVLQKFGIKAALADSIHEISQLPNAPEVDVPLRSQFPPARADYRDAIFSSRKRP